MKKYQILNLKYLVISFIINLVFLKKVGAISAPQYIVKPLYGVEPSPYRVVLESVGFLIVPISAVISLIFGALWLFKKISKKVLLLVLGIVLVGNILAKIIISFFINQLGY